MQHDRYKFRTPQCNINNVASHIVMKQLLHRKLLHLILLCHIRHAARGNLTKFPLIVPNQPGSGVNIGMHAASTSSLNCQAFNQAAWSGTKPQER